MASKLDAAVAKVSALKDDSDMENLAHALLQVSADRKALEDLEGRIRAFAELPADERPVEKVRALYDEAMGRKRGRL